MRFQAYITVLATSMYMATANDTLGDTYSQVNNESEAETVTDLYAVSDALALTEDKGDKGASKGTPEATKKAAK